MTSFIFILFMLILSAGLAYSFYQIRTTEQGQEAHGDDKKAPTHKLQREHAPVEAEHSTDRA
jgi:hypothetical protein